MLLSQRPLSPAAIDIDLAIGPRRELAEQIARNARRQRNTLVLGRRGSGRTSLLSLVEHQLRQVEGRIVCRVDAESCDTTIELIAAVLAVLGTELRGESSATARSLGTARLASGEATSPRAVNETDAAAVVEAARLAVPADSIGVLLIDNLRPEPGHELFGRFRDTLWAAPLVWVAAGDADRDGYLDPPADVFWELVTWLEPLDDAEVRELLGRRIDAARPDDDDAVTLSQHVAELVEAMRGGSPREVLRTAAEVVDTGTTDSALGSLERSRRATAAGGRSAAMLLAELERLHRPVHAGDEELLRRIGLTRPRIVQLLNRLEQAGLVTRHRKGKRILFQAAP